MFMGNVIEPSGSVKELTTAFCAFRSYVGFLVRDIFYKDMSFLNTENIPSDGTPLLIACNHQNSLNDALGIMFSMTDRKVRFIVRADVFKISPVFTKIFKWIGLLPAFRLGWEGEAALQNNDATFKASESALLEGKTVAIFPEAGHQDKHWLGTFSYGYTRMAFGAAEMGGFQKEIFILPACNHYSRYAGLRNSMLVKYGTPISLKPYYELYKTKPRTAQRQVNALVREQISSMMLSVNDLPNYEAIDFIRESQFGKAYADTKVIGPEVLSFKLNADRSLVAALDEIPAEEKQPIYDDIVSLQAAEKQLHITERQMERRPTLSGLIAPAVLLLLLSPLALMALWPSVLSWFVPKYFTGKVGDKMLASSFVIGLNALVILPLCGLITFIVAWARTSIFMAVISTALLPFLCLFEWYYYKTAERLYRDYNYIRAEKTGRISQLQQLREGIFSRLGQIINK